MELYAYQIPGYLEEKEKMIKVVNQVCCQIELKEKKIIIFNLPSDSNLGDHAQTVCIMNFLKMKFRKYNIYSFPTFTKCSYEDTVSALNRLRWVIDEKDIIVFHSGYHINDIYCNEYYQMSPAAMVQLIVLRMFKKNRIIYFPQTINMSEENMGKYAQELDSNKNVALMCRDEVSYELAKKYFHSVKMSLMPDIVTTWIGNYKPPKGCRSGKSVYVALRNREQAESVMTDEKCQYLYKMLKKLGYEIVQGSTTIDEPYEIVKKAPEKFVKEKINEMAHFSLVITDLYHGMIFSVIANTPVLVLQSADHKIKSGMEFFRKYSDFDKRVLYADQFENSMRLLANLNEDDLILENLESSYFLEKYEKVIS